MRLRLSILAAVVAAAVTGLSTSPVYAATPTLRLDPATQLVDLQVITITGAGFTTGSTVRVSECLASDTRLCNPFTAAFLSPDATGSFSYTFAVRREIQVRPGSAEITDCGFVACVFFAVNIANTAERASAPFSFDPKVGPLRINASVHRKVELANNGFTLFLRGTMECTLPATVGIVGFIGQDARDPNSGYPFFTFVNCEPRKSAWSDTIEVSPVDLPFLPGKADVQVVATAQISGFQDVTNEVVVLSAR